MSTEGPDDPTPFLGTVVVGQATPPRHYRIERVLGKGSQALTFVASASAPSPLPTVVLKLWRPSSSSRPADGEVRFVFSGRFVDWKGIQFLIPAFEKAAARNPKCILDLIGGGGEFDADQASGGEPGHP